LLVGVIIEGDRSASPVATFMQRPSLRCHNTLLPISETNNPLSHTHSS